MTQQTNLNVSPYFDDFDASNDYYRVLFKPGYPVQARELTGLQSILQNQIAKFGQHTFKEGAKIIPGNTSYNDSHSAIEINPTHLGVPVESYIEQLLDKKIVGLASGVTAIIDYILKAEDSEKDSLTLYVRYQSADSVNHESSVFGDGELLAAANDITSGPLNSAFIPSGESFASTISTDAAHTGTSFSLSEGVYFIRGMFVNVSTDTIIVSQYTNSPTGRIGLKVNEETVNSDEDPSLTDNSKGFNNYAAPGADRLKITCSLLFKEEGDYSDDNFVELAEVRDGRLISHKVNTQYNILADELARRTYAESGDYTVTPFSVSLRNSLDDRIANNGIFKATQKTDDGAIPSEDLGIYQLSPGKAFVKGYEIEKIGTTLKDVPKPRTTKTLEQQSLNYNTGATVRLNRIYGQPLIGIGNTYIVSLRNGKQSLVQGTPDGMEIGLARVYDNALESGSYSTTNSSLNEWDLSLYDIQTYTTIQLNGAVTLDPPTFVEGKYSGATGFIRENTTSDSLTLYDVEGKFVNNEPFLFDGVDNNHVAIAVTSYGMADVKSIYGGPVIADISSGDAGYAVTFAGNTVQKDALKFGEGKITAYTPQTGLATITSSNPLFPGNLRKENLLKFGGTGNNDPIMVRVVSTTTTSIVVTGVGTVSGLESGAIPSTDLVLSDLTLIETPFTKSLDNSLYTVMARPFISNVDLTDASLDIRKTYDVIIAAATDSLSANITAGTNETFLPFDEERYSLLRADGTTEVLTNDKFNFSNGNTQLSITNIGSALSANQEATLVATLRKTKPSIKIKQKNRVATLVVDKSSNVASGTGSTTLNDGLTYSSGSNTYPYGTRVQDGKIVLNKPDIISILGVFESTDTAEASAPKMTLTAIDSPTGTTRDLTIGEKIIGKDSGAIAVYSEQITNSQVSFCPANDINFTVGETVTFIETNVEAIITTVDNPSKNIGANFNFNSGQKATFYNYGYISRKHKYDAPTKQLKVYFVNGYYKGDDEGDITTKNSYDSFNYNTQIQSIDGNRNTDIIDIRPRVTDYSVSATANRSPLEFFGRSFDQSGNSAKNVLASDEAIVTNYSFYLGRMDRVYLTKGGDIKVVQGVPAEKRELPVTVDDALELATVDLPPYLLDVKDASIQFLKHKRYRMKDIRKLEKRIQNLEYYTSLSLLETATENLFIPDANGLNKFKSGFFVDNFTEFRAQEEGYRVKNSIDPANKECRPTHYTNAVDLQIGPVEGNQATLIYPPTPEGTGIQRTGDIITLKYEELEWVKQTFGTRLISVTPFIMSFWKGSLVLTPATDTWVDTVRLEAQTIEVEGSFAHAVDVAAREFGGWDPQTGLTDTVWNGWETVWTGTETETRVRNRTETSRRRRRFNRRRGNEGQRVEETTTTRTTFQDTMTDNFRTGFDWRSGQRQLITEQWDNFTLGDRTISEEVTPFMRSRNVAFDGKGFKPNARLYAFLDRQDINWGISPKLLEIEMISGTFEVGETVWYNGGGFIGNHGGDLRFRVCQPNHKEGPYNEPTRVYRANPYTSTTGPTALETYSGNPGIVQLATGGSSNVIPSSYSSTSTILNIDTLAMAEQTQGDWYGYIAGGPGGKLRGLTSGAQAKIVNARLVVDYAGTIQGSFFIANPNIPSNPKFEAGTKTFSLTDDPENTEDGADTLGEENYVSSGTIQTVQENVISVRNHRTEVIDTRQERAAREFIGTDTVTVRTGRTRNTERRVTSRWRIGGDPLGQSFTVDDPSGVFVTSADVFFGEVDTENVPVVCEIRTMKGGLPTTKILPFSQVYKDPDQIDTSSDGSVSTRFTFESPVYLEGGEEYALVLQSASNLYKVFISRVGDNDLITDEFISQQPFLGSLFKSQNGSTWDPSQWEDLKFNLNRAKFESAGNLQIYSPILSEGNAQIPKLMPDSINIQSRKIRVGLGTTLAGNSYLHEGVTVSQTGSNATGNLVGFAGSCTTAAMTVVNAGYGYTDGTYTGIALTSLTGSGSGAVGVVTVASGVIASATLSSGGTGYEVGDVLAYKSPNGVGANGHISVVALGATNMIILDNVQGDFVTGAGTTLLYGRSDSGITTQMNWGAQRIYGATLDITPVQDGLHFTVDHKNHGMYHETNRVTLSSVMSDITPTKLSSPYASDSTASISVDSSGDFGTFENVSVAATNPGYALIGDEIISYTGASGGALSGVTRQVDSTYSRNYIQGQEVYKYELGGISLRRINKTHLLSDVGIQTTTNPITFDSYTIKVDTGTAGVVRDDADSFPILYQNSTKSTGGMDVRATQNMPFEVLNLQMQNVTLPGTTLGGEVRTISGSSLNTGSGQGSDLPFVDEGYEIVSINENNYFDSPRIIASRVNETNNTVIQDLPGDRSLNLSVNLATEDDKISPVIDTQRIYAILTSNRVDNMVSNYITDGRVDTLAGDPNSFQYISKENVLESSASTIKIIFDAHLNNYCDVRAFYAVSDQPNFEPIFVNFPGYLNLNERGQVIDQSQNDGRSDTLVPKTDPSGFTPDTLDYREYTFTINELPSFKAFRIKIDFTSTNQAFVPRMTNLRVLSLA